MTPLCETCNLSHCEPSECEQSIRKKVLDEMEKQVNSMEAIEIELTPLTYKLNLISKIRELRGEG